MESLAQTQGNTKETNGFTPLMMAAKQGNVDAVNALLRNGADPNLTDTKNMSVFMYAAACGHTEIVKILLPVTSKQQLNATNLNGKNALMLAAFNGHLDVVKILVGNPDINIYAKDKLNNTALTLAAKRGYKDIAELIQTSIKSRYSLTERIGALIELALVVGLPLLYLFLVAPLINIHTLPTYANAIRVVEMILKVSGVVKALGVTAATTVTATSIVSAFSSIALTFILAALITLCTWKYAKKMWKILFEEGPDVKPLPPNNLKQSNIIRNLQTYITNQYDREDSPIFEDMSRGCCFGLTSIWLYGKSQEHDLTIKGSTAPIGEIDDNRWFKKTEGLISSWDGRRELSKEEAADVERFASLTLLLQKGKETVFPSADSSDYTAYIQDTKERQLTKKHEIDKCLSLGQVIKSLEELKTKGILQEGKAVIIIVETTPDRHIVGIFAEQGDTFSYFDANSPMGEKKAESIADLEKLISETYLSLSLSTTSPIQTTLSIYSLESKQAPPPCPTDEPTTTHNKILSVLDTHHTVPKIKSTEGFLAKILPFLFNKSKATKGRTVTEQKNPEDKTTPELRATKK